MKRQSQDINEVIGTLGYLTGRYLHLFKWQPIDEITADREFQLSLPLGHYLIKHDRPDLLILDLEMPQVHGLVLCEQLRSQPETTLLPILVLTAHKDLENIQKVYSVGADDFVSKPVITPELMTRIFNRLERSDLVKQQTHRDPLTQLLNRSGSLIRFESIINRAIEAHQPLCLGLVSVEAIVELNRTLGYGESDRILSRVAKQLLNLSYQDTVIARWENGEFVVMMPGLTAQAGDRILRQSIMAMKSDLTGVTFGLGVACLDGESISENALRGCHVQAAPARALQASL